MLVLTMYDDDENVFGAMRAGARGYLLKGAEQDEIVRAVTAVPEGEAIFGAGVATRSWPTSPLRRQGPRKTFPELPSGSARYWTSSPPGRNNTAIARRLGLSSRRWPTTCRTSSRSCTWPTGPRPSSGLARRASAADPPVTYF